jgi:hypothetical protein
MAHGVVANVPAPIELYEAVNAQITAQIGEDTPSGLLMHFARKTPDGFQVIELWESKAQADEFEDSVLAPIIERVTEGQAPPREEVSEHFDVHNFFVGPGAAAASSR